MKKRKFYEEFFEMKFECELVQKKRCSPEEQQIYLEMEEREEELPFDIFKYPGEAEAFGRYVELDVDKEHLQEYYTLIQTKKLNTIKNCVVFFTVLTIISMIVALFLALNTCA